MSALSDYLENEILDHILGGGDYTRPASVFVGLFTTAIGDDGSGDEVTGNDYERVEVTNNNTNFPAAVNGVKSNGQEIAFPQPSASWGAVRAVGIFDASSGGNLLFSANLSQQVTIAAGDTPSWPAGSLSFSMQ
jgi:hypothetical protein